MSLNRIVSLHDFESIARRRLPWAVYGFVSGGSEDSRSLRANRRSFEEIALRPCRSRGRGRNHRFQPWREAARAEINRDMALLGCADLAAVTASLLDR